jgi:UDPglucose 6-dehydrogenase
VFIAVGTPSRRGDGHADLSYVFAAVEELAGTAQGPMVVVTKSTVPVGTGDQIATLLKEKGRPRAYRWLPTPNFCERELRSPISSIRIASWSAQRTIARAICLAEIYRPLFLNRATHAVHVAANGRTHQICSQCLSRDQDQLHQ